MNTTTQRKFLVRSTEDDETTLFYFCLWKRIAIPDVTFHSNVLILPSVSVSGRMAYRNHSQ